MTPASLYVFRTWQPVHSHGKMLLEGFGLLLSFYTGNKVHLSLFCVDRVGLRAGKNIYTIDIKSVDTRETMPTLHACHLSFRFILQVCKSSTNAAKSHVSPACQTATCEWAARVREPGSQNENVIDTCNIQDTFIFFVNRLWELMISWEILNHGGKTSSDVNRKACFQSRQTKKPHKLRTREYNFCRWRDCALHLLQWLQCLYPCIFKPLLLGGGDSWHCKCFIIHSASILNK